MIEFECSNCDKKVTVAADQAGKAVKCPSCGQMTLADAGDGASVKVVPPQNSLQLPPPLPGPVGKFGAKRATKTTTTARASLLMGIMSLVLPAAMFIPGLNDMCLFILAEFVCLIGGGICGMAAVLTPIQSKKGKRFALAGMIMCLVVMVPTCLIYILIRLGWFVRFMQ